METDYQNKEKQREIRHIFSDMGLCDCIDIAIIFRLLERADAKGSFRKPLGSLLSASAVTFIAGVMDSSHWDLLDHGGSIEWAWMTDKGKVLLQFFRDFGESPEAWPRWWCSVPLGEDW